MRREGYKEMRAPVRGSTMGMTVFLGGLLLAGCQKPAPQTNEPKVGRFILVQSREQEGDYLLDTATGQVWASYRLKEHGDRLIWLYTTRIDDQQQALRHLKSLAKNNDNTTPLP